MKKIFLSTILLISITSLSACTKTDAMLEDDKVKTKIESIIVDEDYYNEIHNFAGLIKADKKSMISADVPGEIQQIYVRPGDKVNKGDKLALLGDNQGMYEIDISLDNAKTLFVSTEEMLANLIKANSDAINFDGGMVQAAEVSLEKIKTYYNDLTKTYEAQLKQAKGQVENARIALNLAEYNLDSSVNRSSVDKLSLQSQVAQQEAYLASLRSQLKNQKDMNDEMEDSARKALDNARDMLDFAEDNLSAVENDPNSTAADIADAEYAVRQAENQVEMAEESLDSVEEQIDSSEDNLKKQIDIADQQYAGTNYQSESSSVKLDDQNENYKYSVEMSKQSLETAEDSYALLETQKNQALNKAMNDVTEANINVENLRKKLELTKTQAKVSESELKTKLEEISGNISILESKLENKTLIAPFDGSISKQFIQEGAMVDAGTPIFELSDLNTTNVEWYVPENKINTVQIDKTVFVTMESIDEPMMAQITEIEPTAGVFSKKVRVEAKLLDHNENLVDNAYVHVEVMDSSSDKEILVPLSAIEIRYKDQFVYVIENNMLALRKVDLGSPIGDRVIVKSGLKPGDRIVTNPSKKIFDGMEVITQ